MGYRERLATLEANHLLRNLLPVDATVERPYIKLHNDTLLSFNSNDYLGFSTHPAMIEAASKATQIWGTGSTGSRFTSGNFLLHTTLEKQIAIFKQTEAALLFNSGYDANLAVPTTLVQQDDIILSDTLNHASIIDGIRLSKRNYLVYRHRDVEHLRELLASLPATQRKFIFTDSVFSMDGTLAPLEAIVALKKQFHNVIIVVDDAHATGILGEDGRGTANHFALERDIDITIGTLSKACGASGGFIATNQVFADYIRNFARSLIYTTALPPSVVASASTALTLMQEEPWHQKLVMDLTKQLADGLHSRKIHFVGGEVPIFGVSCGTSEKALALQAHLHKAGIFASAIRPPTVPEGEARVRITLSAKHTSEHISLLLQALGGFYDE
ncbi:8-amino-7-oxononanoate synthase [Lysinibacillus sp. LZ02]|uniref:8-amino-7-oxononanoate synthase n=1 Tax=Lysinibacillus sp. LZ02 TaxID=3420668 RepID=UPI003D35E457